MATVVSLEGKRRAPSLEPLLALCADDMVRVDREILVRMRSPVALIPQLANHLVGAGGKRMRPLLTVAAARLCGPSPPSVLSPRRFSMRWACESSVAAGSRRTTSTATFPLP